MEQLRGVGKDVAQDVRTEQQRMLAELRQPLKQLRTGTATRTITVAKPYCTPARPIITAAFQQYGVKIYGYNEYTKTVGPLNAIKNLRVKTNAIETVTRFLDPLPTAQIAEVTVSEQAAAWAEYLLLRTGKLYVPGKYVNSKNAKWAARHGGRMPPAWNEDKPWIEASCGDGMKAWAPLREATKKGKK